jgi:RNA polymerase sigma factor (sigma-70 family)
VLVRNALTILKADQKELLEAAYYEGYSQSELAEKFNMPLGTVKTKMRTALLILRDYISKEKE